MKRRSALPLYISPWTVWERKLEQARVQLLPLIRVGRIPLLKRWTSTLDRILHANQSPSLREDAYVAYQILTQHLKLRVMKELALCIRTIMCLQAPPSDWDNWTMKSGFRTYDRLESAASVPIPILFSFHLVGTGNYLESPKNR